MKTWNEYKDYVKDINQDASDDIEEAEQLAYIISAIIDRRKKLWIIAKRIGYYVWYSSIFDW